MNENKIELTKSELELTIHAIKTAMINETTIIANLRIAADWRGENADDLNEIETLQTRIDEMSFLLTRYQLCLEALKMKGV